MTFDPDFFRSATLKVERANRHIDELQSTLSSFSTTPFYKIIVETDSAGARHIAIIPLQPIPHSLPLIIGDAVHNLRAALDHLATACSRVGGGQGKDLFFPFHKEWKNLVSDTAKLAPIEQAIPGAKNLIINEIQPCENGKGNELYALHVLDRTDKHNQLVLTTAVALSGSLIVRNDAGNDVLLGAQALRFNPNQKTIIPIGPWIENITIEHNYEASMEIFFEEPTILRSKSVIPTLTLLSQNIREIIKSFTSLI